MSPVPKMIVQ